jgi:allantoinase
LAADLIIRGTRVYTPGGPVSGSIHIARGVIESIRPYEAQADAPLFDAGENQVLPGVVDTHVHINEPGRTGWEGFYSATRAAAAGGVTTLVDMPLNSVPATTSVQGFRSKQEAARRQSWVDIGFWGGVIPGNVADLAPLALEGVLGFKCFLTPSGVEEFPHVTESDLRKALPELVRLGAVLLVHAESPALLQPIRGDPAVYSHYLASRPRASEHDAIALMNRLSEEFGAKIHIVHLASADALPVLRQGPLTVETCPHYLTFAAEDIADGATRFKCAPPIRERENRERLWTALQQGEIHLVATDHSPCPPAMKSADFSTAWGGIASLQLSLAIMWNETQKRGIPPERLARWMSAEPAKLAGLAHRKGAIVPGLDADLVVWNPGAPPPAELHHRHKPTPYRPEDYPGAVEATFLRGQKIYHRGSFAPAPLGEILKP